MNRNTLNLVLAVLVAGLAGGAWYAQKQKNAPKPTLTGLAAEGVSSASVAWPDAPEIKLVKTDGHWRLTAPVSARADRFEALNFGNLATSEVKETLTPDGLDLKQIGLDPPERVITLNDQRIEFGNVDPIESRRYVKLGGKVMLIDDPVSAAFDRDYYDLVAKELFASDEEIVGLELPGLSLGRNAEGQWVATPASEAATPQAMAKLVENWKTVNAMWNEAGGEEPKGGTVRVLLKGGETREFVVAGTEPQFSLYSPALKVRFQLSKAVADELLKLPAPTPAKPGPDAAPTPEADIKK